MYTPLLASRLPMERLACFWHLLDEVVVATGVRLRCAGSEVRATKQLWTFLQFGTWAVEHDRPSVEYVRVIANFQGEIRELFNE